MIEKRKPRGVPFKPGNPGRPLGSKNKVTQLVEQLAEGQAEQLVQKAIEMAQAGNVACLRMVLDRVWPVRKGQPVMLDIPEINSLHDAYTTLWRATADGRLTPDEAASLSLVLERLLKATELREIRERLDTLEEKGSTE